MESLAKRLQVTTEKIFGSAKRKNSNSEAMETGGLTRVLFAD